ncbi:MAG TPA: transglutaminase domain-containing protein [Burkholderiales bacterium]|nr:transglutaminase domain-containing protein [Burkholderiales bacterium]
MIKPPPFLLAASLLLWGWYSGFIVAAVGMALALESARIFRLRWELSRRDFERIADLCSIGFAAALAFQFVQSRHFPDSLLSALIWLPMLFFALLLAQRYSTLQRVPLSALFWSLRKRHDDQRAEQALPLDYAYFCLSLLAASSANPRTPWFFPLICVLGVYALWPAAPKRRARSTWALAFIAAIGVAFALQAGLLRAQTHLEELVFEWLASRWNPPADPYHSRTAIGDIGELKGSNRIVMRVNSGGRPPPPTLRAATYNMYAAGTWSAPVHLFTPVPLAAEGWDLAAGTGESVGLSAWVDSERALLALPLGTFRLESLNVAGMQRNAFGVVRVDEAPDMVAFGARYDARHALDAPPDPTDLNLPSTVRPALEKVAGEISLPDHDPQAASQAIAGFFGSRFTYSLVLASAAGTPRSLNQFLLEDRRGHCEYFATATVLLLRYAGIPARYATGYAVQEWSPLERQYVIRKRHAHAWALAWLDGRWQELDTTPGVWADEEAASASSFQPLLDVLSLFNYRLTLWQHSNPAHGGQSVTMLSVAGALALYLAWRVWRRRRVHMPGGSAVIARASPAMSDPRIAELLEQLKKLGYERPTCAPLLSWATALPLTDVEMHGTLESAIRSYYRTRFDPDGATAEEEQFFVRQMRTLLEQLNAASSDGASAARQA